MDAQEHLPYPLTPAIADKVVGAVLDTKGAPPPPRPLDTKCVLCVLCARLALDPTFFADTTSARHTPDTCALGHASSLGPCTHASVCRS